MQLIQHVLHSSHGLLAKLYSQAVCMFEHGWYEALDLQEEPSQQIECPVMKAASHLQPPKTGHANP
ncbi:hypothetical protein [Limnobacter sp.]|uniref:hypothetical protein n=1 Tax=Limnobacter sp. TaxID=2003368 RepID=UPI003516ADD1